MSTSPPKLPTTADRSEYAPYSLTAIIALVVAGLFGLLLLVLGFAAFRAGQPFLQPVLLALPLAAVVLAFAARRQILASEGTKAGLNLADWAWWVAVVGGLGYAAYLAAVGFVIRQDAAAQFDAWAKTVAEIDPNNPRDPALFRAFSRTVEPGRQASLGPTAVDALLKERREEVNWFRQCDVVRLASRAKGEATFTADALQQWELDNQQSLQCVLAARLRTPEGEFGLQIPMQRQQVEGAPRWQIKSGTSFVKAAAVTRYGQLMADVELTASGYAMSEVLPTAANHGLSPAVLRGMTGVAGPYRLKADLAALARAGTVGGYAWLMPPAKADDDAVNALLVSPDPVREATAKARFGQTLRNGRIAPPGVLSQSTVEMSTVVTLAADKIEAKVPVELQPSPNESASRGYVVLVCDDPAVLAKAKELRASAAGDRPGAFQSGASGPIPWRLARIESEMKPLPQARQMRGDMPGGGPNVPGMPGMGMGD